MQESKITSYTSHWTLTAGETNAAGRMPITLIAARAIETATLHANALSIGYSNLKGHRLGWVLARMAIEVIRYPQINEAYSMTTWIEGYNKYFSDRCYAMTDTDGNVLAHIRSVWVAIDIDSRTMADLTTLGDNFPVLNRACPVAKCRPPMIARDADTAKADYTFRYTDIDFNGHVNTLRYIEAVLNLHNPAFYADHIITAMEASFDRECHYGDTVSLVSGPSGRDSRFTVTEIIGRDDKRCVSIALVFN